MNKRGVVLICSIIALLSMGATVLITKPEIFHGLSKDHGRICFERQKSALKDPYSAVYEGAAALPDHADTVTISYRAKNSYGAYEIGSAVCSFDGDQVNEDRTSIIIGNMEMQKRIRKLDVEIKCIESANKLMLNENIYGAANVAKVRNIQGCEDYRGPN